jgi:putative transposase
LEDIVMAYDPYKHHRRSIRLKGYDYSQDGLYFITICIKNGLCLLGDVVGDEMVLNPAGQMVEAEWLALPGRFPQVEQDVFQVMPNHFHGILGIQNTFVGAGLVPAQDDAATATGRAITTERATTRVAPTVVGDVGAGLVPAQDDATTATGRAITTERATTRVAPTVVGDVGAGLVPAQDNAATATDRATATGRATTRVAPTGVGDAPVRTVLGNMIGAFKSITTNEYIVGVNELGWEPFPGKLWQRNFYEHIIRNERALKAIREYIINNPANWAADQLHPDAPPNQFNATWMKK